MGFSAWGIQTGPFAILGAHFVSKDFQLFHFHTGRPILIAPEGWKLEKGIHPTSKLNETEGFQCLGHSNWTMCSPLSPFCPRKFSEQKGLGRLQMVQFECPRHWNPSVSSSFGVWRVPFSPLLALWGNKNWPPSMKVKKLKIFSDKMGSKGCKWSSLNASGTETPLSHPILKLWESAFSHY